MGSASRTAYPSRIADRRSSVRFGGYAPENFDLTFQGTVTVRRALQLSLNVPAVAVLDKVGSSRFAARLAQAGGTLRAAQGRGAGARHGARRRRRQSRRSRHPLCRPRLGTSVPLTERIANARAAGGAPAARAGRRLVCRQHPARHAAARQRRRRPHRFKTGTSYGYRDAWAVGFDGKRTIGVWVGRPDGAPVPGLVGRVAAAPILFDAFARTGKLPAMLPGAPKGALMAATGKLPPPLQRFRPGVLAGEGGEPQVRIMFPPNGARLELAGDAGKPDPIALKVTGVGPHGAGQRQPLPASPGRRAVLRAGRPRLRAAHRDGCRGATDSVMVRLQWLCGRYDSSPRRGSSRGNPVALSPA